MASPLSIVKWNIYSPLFIVVSLLLVIWVTSYQKHGWSAKSQLEQAKWMSEKELQYSQDRARIARTCAKYPRGLGIEPKRVWELVNVQYGWAFCGHAKVRTSHVIL